jgi:ubiquinone/menaquinone biosynthesis C-methylase UbiE
VIADLATRHGEPFVTDFLDTVTAYTDWSAVYDGPNALIDAEEVVLREMLGGIPPGKALDVGCGTGRVTEILVSLGHEVTGIDPTPAMLEAAKAKSIRATFVDGDVSAMSAADESVDLVTCSLALTHVEDLGSAMMEMARVVRPGGVVVLSDVHPIAVATGAHAGFRREDGSRGTARNHVHWHSVYIEAFIAAGLVIERCEEPLVGEPFFESLGSEEVRGAAGAALEGLPFALLWRLRKR